MIRVKTPSCAKSPAGIFVTIFEMWRWRLEARWTQTANAYIYNIYIFSKAVFNFVVGLKVWGTYMTHGRTESEKK
jgi:hypothetical protein